MSKERANQQLRFFDEHLGPIAVWFAGIIRRFARLFESALLPMRAPPLETVQTVGLLKLAAIGDTVLLSGLVQDLRSWKPDVRIVLFVGGSNEAYAKLLPSVDEVIRLPLTDLKEAWKLLRKENFDLLFNTDPWARISALFGACARAKWLVGFETPGQFRHYADDQLVQHRSDKHEADNFRALLKAVGIPAGALPIKPRTPQNPPIDSSLIIFHFWPGGTKSYLKEWSAANWRQLSVLLSERGPFHFLLSGSPDQHARNEAWIQSLPWELRARFTNIAGHPLEKTIELLSSARVVVSVDTGIMHVSAALGTPTVSLHGPTRPERWGGLGPSVFPVMSKAPGAGQLHLGFDYFGETNFLDAITVDQVYAKVEKALEVRR